MRKEDVGGRNEFCFDVRRYDYLSFGIDENLAVRISVFGSGDEFRILMKIEKFVFMRVLSVYDRL